MIFNNIQARQANQNSSNATSNRVTITPTDRFDLVEKLGPNAFIVYQGLCSFGKGSPGTVFPSVQTLAERCHLSVRSTHRGLDKLEKFGMIEFSGKFVGHGVKVYHIHFDLPINRTSAKSGKKTDRTSANVGRHNIPVFEDQTKRTTPLPSIVDGSQPSHGKPESDKLLFFQIENSKSNTIELNQAEVIQQEPQKGQNQASNSDMVSTKPDGEKTPQKTTQPKKRACQQREIRNSQIVPAPVEKQQPARQPEPVQVVPNVPKPVGCSDQEWFAIQAVLSKARLSDSIVAAINLELAIRLDGSGSVRAPVAYAVALIKSAKITGAFFSGKAAREQEQDQEMEKFVRQQEEQKREKEEQKRKEQRQILAKVDAFLGTRTENELVALRSKWAATLPKMMREMFTKPDSVGGQKLFNMFIYNEILQV